MSQFIEKRNYIRIPLTFITVSVADSPDKAASSETCSVVDISENGMKFVSKKHYAIHQPLNIAFILPNSTIPIQAESIVVYQQPHGSLRYTGIQFTKLDLIEFSLLKKFIEINTEQN